jgi:hypothetical protein
VIEAIFLEPVGEPAEQLAKALKVDASELVAETRRRTK